MAGGPLARRVGAPHAPRGPQHALPHRGGAPAPLSVATRWGERAGARARSVPRPSPTSAFAGPHAACCSTALHHRVLCAQRQVAGAARPVVDNQPAVLLEASFAPAGPAHRRERAAAASTSHAATRRKAQSAGNCEHSTFVDGCPPSSQGCAPWRAARRACAPRRGRWGPCSRARRAGVARVRACRGGRGHGSE